MKTIITLLLLAAAVATGAAQDTPGGSELTDEQAEALRAAALDAATDAAASPDTTAAPSDSPGSPAVAPPDLGTSPAAAATPPEELEIISAGEINFPSADIDMVLDIYATYVNRTILRPAALPATAITLKTQTDLTKDELIMALDAVLALNGISMINVGDKFVKAVPEGQAGAAGAEVSRADVDSLPDLGQYLTHVVQLKHVKVSEAIPALQPFAKIPNSVLAIESVNMIVLRDFTENVKRMLEMLDRIDVAVESEYISEVIPIKYALAGDIASALNSLSTGGGSTTVGGGSVGGGMSMGRSSRGGMGNRMSTRPVGGYGSSGAYGGYGANTGFYPQQVAPGTAPAAGASFTDRLRTIINKASTEGDLEILGQTRIIADERTNSLLIFASKRDMTMIKDIISKLDVVLAQVLIEALVIEVGLGNDLAWGVSYLQNPQGSDGDWKGAGGVFNNVNFIQPDAIRNATNLLGGFSYYAKYRDDLLIAVTAAARDNNVSILSRPRVQTSHAVEANLFVGETRPYPTGSSYGGVYGGYSSIQQQRIGIELNVLPLINPDGLVVMEIAQNIQSVGGQVLIENVGEVPITQDRSANAMVAVKSGETIVLGGFISADKSYTDSGVPFLKDIPGLGLLFRAQSNNKNRRELMIFIKPTVLETPEIAARVAIEEKNKMPGVLGAEKELTKEYEEAMRKVGAETSANQ